MVLHLLEASRQRRLVEIVNRAWLSPLMAEPTPDFLLGEHGAMSWARLLLGKPSRQRD
jgi:hypothetical protein